MTWIIILSILIFAILLAKIIFSFLQHYKSQKVKQLTEKDLSFPLPILVLPEKDIKAGNGIDRVFINITKKPLKKKRSLTHYIISPFIGCRKL